MTAIGRDKLRHSLLQVQTWTGPTLALSLLLKYRRIHTSSMFSITMVSVDIYKSRKEPNLSVKARPSRVVNRDKMKCDMWHMRDTTHHIFPSPPHDNRDYVLSSSHFNLFSDPLFATRQLESLKNSTSCFRLHTTRTAASWSSTSNLGGEETWTR